MQFNIYKQTCTVIGAVINKMGLFGILMYAFMGQGRDIPNVVANQTVLYKAKDVLQIQVQLENLQVQPNQNWSSIICEHNGMDCIPLTEISFPLSEPYYYDTPLNHTNNIQTTFYLRVYMGDIIVYEKKILTLVYNDHRLEHNSICITRRCIVRIDKWSPKVIITSPVDDIIKYNEENKHTLRCVPVNLGQDPRVAWINQHEKIIAVTNELILKKSFHNMNLQCVGYFKDEDGKTQTVRSDRSITVEDKTPYVDLKPKSSEGIFYAVAGEKIKITCTNHHMPLNTRNLIYRNDGLIQDYFGKVVEGQITLKEGENKVTVYCISTFSEAVTKRFESNKVTIVLKDMEKRNKASFITEPKLNSETHYQVGDRFKYKCSAKIKNITKSIYWIRQKDGKLLETSTTPYFDIILDESYNNNTIACVIDYLSDKAGTTEKFLNETVSTILVLNTPSQPQSYPWYIALIILVIIFAAVASICTYRYKTRKIVKNYDVVEVENELYLPANYAVTYAQIYEHRAGAPPPSNLLEYSKIIGYLQPNDNRVDNRKY